MTIGNVSPSGGLPANRACLSTAGWSRSPWGSGERANTRNEARSAQILPLRAKPQARAHSRAPAARCRRLCRTGQSQPAAPNLADLEVAKRNQVSREGAAMTETTANPLNNFITIDGERTASCQRAAESPHFWASKIPRFGGLLISRWGDRSLRFWGATTALGLRRERCELDQDLWSNVLWDEIGVLAQAVGALDLDDDGVVEKPV